MFNEFQSYYLTSDVSLFWNLETNQFYLAKAANDFWLADLPKGKHLFFDNDISEIAGSPISLYASLAYLEKDQSKITQVALLLSNEIEIEILPD